MYDKDIIAELNYVKNCVQARFHHKHKYLLYKDIAFWDPFEQLMTPI